MHRSENSSKVVCSTIPTGDGRDSKSKPDNQQPMNQDKVSTIGPTITETPPGKLASGGLQEAAKEARAPLRPSLKSSGVQLESKAVPRSKRLKRWQSPQPGKLSRRAATSIHEQKGNLARKVQELCGGSSWGVEEAARRRRQHSRRTCRKDGGATRTDVDLSSR